MANVTTLTTETMLAVIDAQQVGLELPINSDTVVLSGPLTMVGRKNTQLNLTGTGEYTEGYPDVYIGRASVQYDRLDLAVLFRGIPFDLELIPEDRFSSLHGALEDLSERYGMVFYPEDIEDTPLDVTMPTVEFKAKADSLNFTGTVALNIVTKDTDLSELLTTLDIYVEPDTKSDLLYTTGDKPLFPVNARRLTANDLFKQYATGLSTAIDSKGMLTKEGSDLIRQILRIEYGLVVGVFNHEKLQASILKPDGKGDCLRIDNLTASDYLLFEYGERE